MTHANFKTFKPLQHHTPCVVVGVSSDDIVHSLCPNNFEPLFIGYRPQPISIGDVCDPVFSLVIITDWVICCLFVGSYRFLGIQDSNPLSDAVFYRYRPFM